MDFPEIKTLKATFIKHFLDVSTYTKISFNDPMCLLNIWNVTTVAAKLKFSLKFS